MQLSSLQANAEILEGMAQVLRSQRPHTAKLYGECVLKLHVHEQSWDNVIYFDIFKLSSVLVGVADCWLVYLHCRIFKLRPSLRDLGAQCVLGACLGSHAEKVLFN